MVGNGGLVLFTGGDGEEQQDGEGGGRMMCSKGQEGKSRTKMDILVWTSRRWPRPWAHPWPRL